MLWHKRFLFRFFQLSFPFVLLNIRLEYLPNIRLVDDVFPVDDSIILFLTFLVVYYSGFQKGGLILSKDSFIIIIIIISDSRFVR